MFQKTLIILSLSAITALSQTEVTQYLSVSGGFGNLAEGDININTESGKSSYDQGGSFEIAYGVKLDKGVETFPARFEIAGGYQANKMNEFDISGGGTLPLDGDVQTFSLMGNAYLDILTGSFVTPYLMIGLGGANVDFEGDDDNVFLFQIGAGAGFEVSEHWIIDLKLKAFTAPGDYNFDDGTTTATAEISGAQVQIGARYMF